MKKILLVEDDPVSCMLLEAYLKNNYEVHIAGTIADAKKCLHDKSIDLVLLDYVLPDGLGHEVLDEIQSKKISCRAIVITKYSNLEIIRLCRLRGAFDFVQKPVSRAVLTEFVEVALDYPNMSAMQNQPEVHNRRSHITHSFDWNSLARDAHDPNLTTKILLLATKQLPAIRSQLRTISVCKESPDSRDVMTQSLELLVSLSTSLHANSLLQIAEDLFASLQGGNWPQLSDLEFVCKEIDRLETEMTSTLAKMKDESLGSIQDS